MACQDAQLRQVVMEYLVDAASTAAPRAAAQEAKGAAPALPKDDDDDEVVIVGERLNAPADLDPAPKRRKAMRMRQTQITCEKGHAMIGAAVAGCLWGLCCCVACARAFREPEFCACLGRIGMRRKHASLTHVHKRTLVDACQRVCTFG